MNEPSGILAPGIVTPKPGIPAKTSQSRRSYLYPFIALVRYLRVHPLRAIGWGILLALVFSAMGFGTFYLWYDHHRRAARQALELGHTSVAIDHLKRCREYRPDAAEIMLLSARATRYSNAWTESEALLDRYSQLHGDDDAVVLERLCLRATRGEIEAVGPLLRSKMSIDAATASLARESLIAGLIYRYQLNNAETEIDRWLEQAPDNTHALLQQGKLFEQREQSSDALRVYRRILELDPEYDEIRLRLTTVLIRLRQGEEALPHLEFLRRRAPDHAEILLQTGQALDLQGREDEARTVLDECLHRHPGHPGALVERGRIARIDGDSIAAEEYLSLAVKLDPGNGPAHYQYYLTLNQNGKKAEAQLQQDALRKLEMDVERINELIKVRLQSSPEDPAIHYEIGVIILRAGRPKEAMRWFQSALQVSPDHLPTHRMLAGLHYEMGNPILSARHRAIAQRLTNQGK